MTQDSDQYHVSSDEQAKAMLAALHRYYREPCLPVSRYCKALSTWSDKYVAIAEDPMEMLYRVQRLSTYIRKSNLLYRLIYLGEELRTVECPEHKGKWSGCHPKPCQHGCGYTGWLPNGNTGST